ncbi:MAG TPA: amino acid adenylation domain-containing protein, partial [Candidatus Limnocylindrales bacterium]|nr:amino acid adenylation domain-containing protein [Candidatus Limnocylindrales bacterium]
MADRAGPAPGAAGASTLRDVVGTWARRTPTATALVAPGQAALTWVELDRFLGDAVAALHALGVGHGGRVLSVLEDGACTLTAFLAVSGAATFIPINPGYPPRELEAYLDLLTPTVVLLPAGDDSPARRLAAARRLPVITLTPSPDGHAGRFTLDGVAAPADTRPPGPDDVALILHTSGTTSRPKVVPLTHRNLCVSAANFTRAHELGPADRCLNVTPMFHVLGLMPLVAALGAGGSVACPPAFQAPRFFDWLAELRPTWFSAPPAIFEAILFHVGAPSRLRRPTVGESPREVMTRAAAPGSVTRGHALRFLRLAAAAASPDLLSRLEEAFGIPAIQVYGSTEASIVSSNPLPPRPRKRGSAGLPVMAHVRVADEAGRPLAPGEIGQLLLRGDNVTPGYENDPDANARAFLDGWFRTGDAAWLDEDGYLFIAGRLDEVINRGGQKISPREIDEALLRHPAVSEAAAFPVPHPVLGQEVAAAVVLRPGVEAAAHELRAFTADRLVAYKVPREIVVLAEMPRGASGKVPRHALAARLGLAARPAPDGRARPLGLAPAVFVPPDGPIECPLAAIWQSVLRVERVGRHDDFFALGGDSILASLVTARARERLSVQVPILALFESPTLAAFAAVVAASAPRPSAVPAEAHGAAAADDGHPLASFGQRRLWFLDRLDPGSPRYNLPHALLLAGSLDVAGLGAALDAVVERHATLRTAFTLDGGEPRQIVVPHRPLELPVTDIAGLEPAARAVRLREAIDADAREPFDLTRGRVLRARLVRLGADEHVLVLVVHHIAADAWSMAVLFRELSSVYRARREGASPALPPLRATYADLALRQRAHLAGPAAETALEYWQRRLAGAPLALDLSWRRGAFAAPAPDGRGVTPAGQFPRRGAFAAPAPDGRAVSPPSHVGARLAIEVPPALQAALLDLGRRESATLFMILLAGLAALVHRYTGLEDFVLGAPVAGRTETEAEPLIGFFVNTLALRLDTSGDPPFGELLARVRDTVLGAYAHQELPFERLVEALRLPRDATRSPLVQVAVALHQSPLDALDLPGVGATALDVDTGASVFDLTLFVVQSSGGLRVVAEYSTDLFDAGTITQIVERWLRVLGAAADDPARRLSSLPLMDAAERERLIGLGDESRRPFPADRTIHDLFLARAIANPGAIAIMDGEATISYGALADRASRLAHRLRRLGVGPDVVVGVSMERSAALVETLVGILLAGGAYLPLDPTLPRARLQLMLEAARASLVLAAGMAVAQVEGLGPPVLDLDAERRALATEPGEPPASGAGAEHLAYGMYTSGSSGAPTGVAVPHRAVVRLVVDTDYCALGPDDVVAQASTVAFDASTFEIWGALLNGARLVVVPAAILMDPGRLGQSLAREGVTTLFLTPAVLGRVAREAPASLAGLRHLVVGGDVLEPRWVDELLRHGPPARIVNGYGPTETTTFAAWHLVGPRDGGVGRIPIGRPIANTEIHILDARLEPVPAGVPGELCIGGPGLARGYLNDAELTARRFIPHPFRREPGARLYRTGDRVRRRSDGLIDFLGRIDRQVKIRGFRVEPSEIEAALERHPAVQGSAVIVDETAPGDRRLVAYVVAPGSTVAELRAYLRQSLPEYMVPAALVAIPALPLTPGGKLDRSALPPPVASPADGKARVEP